MFDIKGVAKEYGLSKGDVAKIRRDIRKEFPKDEVLYELHVIRAIMSKGHAY